MTVNVQLFALNVDLGDLMADHSQPQSWRIDEMPEVFVSRASTASAVSRAVKAGRLRKLASRLYTRNLAEPAETLISRNLWQIVAGYYPGAVISDRTAIEGRPASDGSVFLVTDSDQKVDIPGYSLRPRKGAGPLEDDRPFLGGLFYASTARAFLENMRATRARAGASRTLSRPELEARLDDFVRRAGETGINELRDRVRELGPSLDITAEAHEFDRIVGALLGTRKATLSAPSAVARQLGRAYDPDRLRLFLVLQAALRRVPPSPRPIPRRSAEERSTIAFFDAYFSNFIEGTKFVVEEAEQIVFHGAVPADRPEDAHDVLGTWRIVSDDLEMSRRPETPGALLGLLRHRHRHIMEMRPDKRPGELKRVPNQAGTTVFVAPDLVPGTLEKAFDVYRSLETPFQRAAFMMFAISEVHPFVDGNGRVARIMMNAELVAGGEERIIIPTVYRANYLAALKALSQSAEPDPLIRVLDFAHTWTSAISWGSVQETIRQLKACNALMDSHEAEAGGRRLLIPDPGPTVGTEAGPEGH